MGFQGGTVVFLFVVIFASIQVHCDDVTLAPSQERCGQAVEQGGCADYVERWFYNKEVAACLRFKYTGCGGNGNNFVSEAECRSTCMNTTVSADQPSTTPQAAPSSTAAELNNTQISSDVNSTVVAVSNVTAEPATTPAAAAATNVTDMRTNMTTFLKMIEAAEAAAKEAADSEEEVEEKSPTASLLAVHPDGDDDLDDETFDETANIFRLNPALEGKIHADDLETIEEMMSEGQNYIMNKTIALKKTTENATISSAPASASVAKEQATPVSSNASVATEQATAAAAAVPAEATKTVSKAVVMVMKVDAEPATTEQQQPAQYTALAREEAPSPVPANQAPANQASTTAAATGSDDVTAFGQAMLREIKKEGAFDSKFMSPLENEYLAEMVSQFDIYQLKAQDEVANRRSSSPVTVGEQEVASRMRMTETINSQPDSAPATVAAPSVTTKGVESAKKNAADDDDDDNDEEGDIETFVGEAIRRGLLAGDKMTYEEQEIVNSMSDNNNTYVLQVAKPTPRQLVKAGPAIVTASKPTEGQGQGQRGVPMRCQLRPETGPCKAGTGMWYYDAAQGRCAQFIYGGCLGNANRFATVKECAAVCVGQMAVMQKQAEQPVSDVETEMFPLREGPNDLKYDEEEVTAGRSSFDTEALPGNRQAAAFFLNLFSPANKQLRPSTAALRSTFAAPEMKEMATPEGDASPVFVKLNMPAKMPNQQQPALVAPAQPRFVVQSPQQQMGPEPPRYFAPSISKDFHFEKAMTDNRRQTFASPNTKFNLFQVFIDQKEFKRGGRNNIPPPPIMSREANLSPVMGRPQTVPQQQEAMRSAPPAVMPPAQPVQQQPPKVNQPPMLAQPKPAPAPMSVMPKMYPYPVFFSFPSPPPPPPMMPFFYPHPYPPMSMAYPKSRPVPMRSPVNYVRVPTVKRLLLKPVRPVFRKKSSKHHSHHSKPSPVVVAMVSARPSNTCQLPVASGMCHPSVIRWFYNSQLRQCQRFNYGGCHGNANRFTTAEECQRTCLDTDVKTTTEYPPGTIVVTQPVYVPAGAATPEETTPAPAAAGDQTTSDEISVSADKDRQDSAHSASHKTSTVYHPLDVFEHHDESAGEEGGVVDIRQSFIVILVLCVVTAAVLILVTISLARFCLKRHQQAKQEAAVQEAIKQQLQATLPVMFTPQSTENIYNSMKSGPSSVAGDVESDKKSSHL